MSWIIFSINWQWFDFWFFVSVISFDFIDKCTRFINALFRILFDNEWQRYHNYTNARTDSRTEIAKCYLMIIKRTKNTWIVLQD